MALQWRPLTRRGLPAYTDEPGGGGVPPLAAWVVANQLRLQLDVRIVDFWAGSRRSRSMKAYLERNLPFARIVLEDRAQQKGLTCGIVAARVVVDMKHAGNDWRTVDVRRAVEWGVVREGNRRLGINLDNLHAIETELSTIQVSALAQSFWLPPPPGPEDPGHRRPLLCCMTPPLLPCVCRSQALPAIVAARTTRQLTVINSTSPARRRSRRGSPSALSMRCVCRLFLTVLLSC